MVFIRKLSLGKEISHKLAYVLYILFISREVNRLKHSKPGSVSIVSEKKKHIVAVVK